MAVVGSGGVTLHRHHQTHPQQAWAHLVHQNGVVDPGVVYGVPHSADDEVVRPPGVAGVLHTSEQIAKAEGGDHEEAEQHDQHQQGGERPHGGLIRHWQSDDSVRLLSISGHSSVVMICSLHENQSVSFYTDITYTNSQGHSIHLNFPLFCKLEITNFFS